MNICFFCSAANVDEKYIEPAKRLAEMVARDGHVLVWGGSARGLMNEIATAAKGAGGRVIGISMEQLSKSAFEGADTMIFTKTLAERKKQLLENSDAIVCLVGGTGTLDELTDLFELRRYGDHNKRIVVLNTDNFFEGLKLQYQRMQEDGFLKRMPRPISELITFVNTPEEVMDFLSEEQEEIPLAELKYSGEAV